MAVRRQSGKDTAATDRTYGRYGNGQMKGDLYYLTKTKKRQLILVTALAGIILTIFLVGLWLYRQSKNPLTIVAAVAVVPFASALLRLILLEKGAVTEAERQRLIAVLDNWQPVTATTVEKVERFYGPAVYTFGGRVWPIPLLLIEAEDIYLVGVRQPETAKILQAWLQQAGFTVRVKSICPEECILQAVSVSAVDAESEIKSEIKSEIESEIESEMKVESETVRLLYRYLKTLIV